LGKRNTRTRTAKERKCHNSRLLALAPPKNKGENMNLENLIEDKYMKGQMTFEEYEDAQIELELDRQESMNTYDNWSDNELTGERIRCDQG
jgi:hypothetical protein